MTPDQIAGNGPTINYLALGTLRQHQAALTDAEFIAWANTPVLTTTNPVIEKGNFSYYLFANGLYAKMLGAQLDARPEVAGLAATAIAYLASPDFKTVVWTDPIMVSCMGGFVAAGIFTQADKDAAEKALTQTWSAPLAGVTQEDLANVANHAALRELSALAAVEYEQALATWNARQHKIGAMMMANTPCPANLAELDLVVA